MHVRQPLLALHGALSEALAQIDPELEFRPGRCLSSAYADARFCHGSPLKEYMYLRFRLVTGDRANIPGFFFDASNDLVRYGLQLYKPTAAGVQAVRRAVLANPAHAERLLTDLEAPPPVGLYGKDYAQDNWPQVAGPEKGWLNKREWAFYQKLPEGGLYFRPELAAQVSQTYARLSGIYHLVKRALHG